MADDANATTVDDTNVTTDDQKKSSQITGNGAAGSSTAKESEPAPSVPGKTELTSPREKTLSPEVVEYIKKQEESIKVPEALKNIGVSAGVDEDIPMGGPTLPISDKKIVIGLKQPINSSVRWLAELALFILKQAHYTVKVINGHIRRIIYTGKE